MSNEEGSELDGHKKINPRITPPKEDVFMGLIYMTAVLSKDPVTQQCALLVDSKDRWVSYGVNYIPKPEHGQQGYKWDEEGREVAMVPADVAAIDRGNKLYVPGVSYTDAFTSHTLYITSPPSLAGVQSAMRNGLKKFIYGKEIPGYFSEAEWERTQLLAKNYRIELIAFKGNLGWVADRVMSLSNLFM